MTDPADCRPICTRCGAAIEIKSVREDGWIDLAPHSCVVVPCTVYIDAIRARCAENITEIVSHPAEYYRVQQILRDRADLLAEVDRLESQRLALLRGEFICSKCGLRKDGEKVDAEF